MRSIPPPRLATFALILLSIIWGYNWVVMKEVIRYVDPFDFSALRTLLGAISLFALLLVLRRPLRISALRPIVILGLLQTALFTALIQWALVAGNAGKTAVLVYTMPFWLIPIAWWTLGERVRGLQWLAIAIAGVGLCLILEPWKISGGMFSNYLALGGGLSWALSTIVAKRLRQNHQLDLLAMTAWQMLFGAIVLCLLALFIPSKPIEPTGYFYAALAFNALGATGLAWVLWLYVLRHLPASTAGLSSLGVPAIGVLAAWFELGETPSLAELGGMLLIAGALLLIYLYSQWQARRSHSAGK